MIETAVVRGERRHGGIPFHCALGRHLRARLRNAHRISACIRNSPVSIAVARRNRRNSDARRCTSSRSTGVCGEVFRDDRVLECTVFLRSLGGSMTVSAVKR